MKEERREKRKLKEAQMRRVACLEALMEENHRKGINFIQSVLQVEVK